MSRLICAVTLVLAVAAPHHLTAQEGAEGEVRRVVDSFHRALSAGDSIAALAFLAEDVVILEGGRAETLEQYRSGHLRGDMRYAQAVDRQRGELRVSVSGNLAWAHSSSVVTGSLNGREIDSQGVELVILALEGEAWLIKAIHWSSRSRSTG